MFVNYCRVRKSGELKYKRTEYLPASFSNTGTYGINVSEYGFILGLELRQYERSYFGFL